MHPLLSYSQTVCYYLNEDQYCRSAAFISCIHFYTIVFAIPNIQSDNLTSLVWKADVADISVVLCAILRSDTIVLC